MDRRTFLTTAAGIGTVAVAGCTGGSASGEFDVGMTTSRFDPPTIEVATGTTVRWKNTSSHSHTVTAYESGIPERADYWATGGYDGVQAAREAWRSSGGGGLDPGDTYERTFTVPGTHQYFCIPHEPSGMVGKVVVTESERSVNQTTTAPGTTTE